MQTFNFFYANYLIGYVEFLIGYLEFFIRLEFGRRVGNPDTARIVKAYENRDRFN